VYIKLKSTTTATGPDESVTDLGLAFDGYGYGVSFPHFAGLLTSPEFIKYVEEVRETADSPAEDPPLEKRQRVGEHFLAENNLDPREEGGEFQIEEQLNE
jgi:hypothetical protein